MATITVSADHWFERTGTYQFNPMELPQAHEACLRAFIKAVQTCTNLATQVVLLRGLPGCGKSTYVKALKGNVIVVDNTNLTVEEVAPYYAIANAYGLQVKVVTILCDAKVAAGRGIHGVPEAAYERMERVMSENTTRFPSRWVHQFVRSDETPK